MSLSIYTFILLSSIILEILKAKEVQRYDFSVAIELLCAYTIVI